MTSSADLAEYVTAGVASLADIAAVVTDCVAPSAEYDGDVTTGVTSMVECVECEALEGSRSPRSGLLRVGLRERGHFGKVGFWRG